MAELATSNNAEISNPLEFTATDPMFRPWPVLLDCCHRRVCVDVTGTRAITQFAYRVADVRIFVFLVWSRPVIVGMASCTVRLVRGSRPGHRVGVALVTRGAGEIAAMVQRLVRQAHVHIDVRNPGNGLVTDIALLLRAEMAVVLACRGSSIMTGRAGTENLAVINGNDGTPRRCAVAVLADVRRQDVLRMLPGGIRAVVTADAVAGDVDVVEVRRDPGVRGVAVVAVVAARDMRRVFPGRDDAIVAGATATQDLGMVDRIRGRKDDRVVAVLANIGGLYMKRVLARRVEAIVTGEAAARDFAVVKYGRYPEAG